MKKVDDFLILAAASKSVSTLAEFNQWVTEFVKPIMPFDMMMAMVARKTKSAFAIMTISGLNYPEEYINQVNEMDWPIQECHMAVRWLETLQPQFAEQHQTGTLLSELEREEFDRFDMQNLAVYGVIDVNGIVSREFFDTKYLTATYFMFSRIPVALDENYKILMELVVPHLHHTLLRVHHLCADTSRNADMLGKILSKKEREILQLMTEGKSNKEIASTLCRSELTVRNHVQHILQKLGVNNRMHAFSRALEIGLLGVPSQAG